MRIRIELLPDQFYICDADPPYAMQHGSRREKLRLRIAPFIARLALEHFRNPQRAVSFNEFRQMFRYLENAEGSHTTVVRRDRLSNQLARCAEWVRNNLPWVLGPERVSFSGGYYIRDFNGPPPVFLVGGTEMDSDGRSTLERVLGLSHRLHMPAAQISAEVAVAMRTYVAAEHSYRSKTSNAADADAVFRELLSTTPTSGSEAAAIQLHQLASLKRIQWAIRRGDLSTAENHIECLKAALSGAQNDEDSRFILGQLAVQEAWHAYRGGESHLHDANRRITNAISGSRLDLVCEPSAHLLAAAIQIDGMRVFSAGRLPPTFARSGVETVKAHLARALVGALRAGDFDLFRRAATQTARFFIALASLSDIRESPPEPLRSREGCLAIATEWLTTTFDACNDLDLGGDTLEHEVLAVRTLRIAAELGASQHAAQLERLESRRLLWKAAQVKERQGKCPEIEVVRVNEEWAQYCSAPFLDSRSTWLSAKDLKSFLALLLDEAGRLRLGSIDERDILRRIEHVVQRVRSGMHSNDKELQKTIGGIQYAMRSTGARSHR